MRVLVLADDLIWSTRLIAQVQAAGAVIGAVMKAMKGQADAARVRELVLERAQA